MREKFKKGEIVTATRTFNGEIITGEFRGYRLFNDEIPDTVVGIVDVPGEGVYDVDVTSIRHHESKDERIRKELIEFIQWSEDRGMTRHDFHQAKRPSEWIAYLEKQKECLADNSKISASEDEKIRKELIFFLKEEIPQCSIKEHANKLKEFVSYLEKQKEQKPAEWNEEDNIGWDEAFACVTRAEKAAKNEEELQNAVTAEKWLKEIKFKYCVHPVKQEWSEEDESELTAVIYCVSRAIKASKDENERNSLLSAKKWLQDKLSFRVKSLRPSCKPVEWSDEEFETFRKTLAKDAFLDEITSIRVAKKLLNSVKHLRPSWKPSEEQMGALEECGECKRCIKELREQLQKLWS